MVICLVEQIFYKVVWFYYMYGLCQDEVVKYFDIFCVLVVMYLCCVCEMGIVMIVILMEFFLDDVFVWMLEDCFGFDMVWIVLEGGYVFDFVVEMLVVVVVVFQSFVNKGDKIGVVWGWIVYYIVDVMFFVDL